MLNYVPVKHKQMSFVSNGGKLKVYTVLNGLIFPTPTQPRISFERAIFDFCRSLAYKYQIQKQRLCKSINDRFLIKMNSNKNTYRKTEENQKQNN
jgi:hypothetical protein